MSRQLLAPAVVCLFVFGLVGCNGARYVTVEPNGGVVAIPHNTNSWPEYNRKNAEALMQQKCPQGYVIDREQEVVTGTTQQTHTDTEKTGDPMLAALKISPVEEKTTQRTSYTDQTEWRIWFHGK